MRTLQETRIEDATVRVEYEPLLSWLSEKALLVGDVIGVFASRVELFEGRWRPAKCDLIGDVGVGIGAVPTVDDLSHD